jgi:hypothetical protein
MSDNRYRPPAAQVADFDWEQNANAPMLLKAATILLVGTLAAGLVSVGVQWSFLRSQAPAGFVLLVGGSTAALIGWLTYKIWKRRNWARIVLLILFVAGVPMSLPQFSALLTRSPVAAVIFVLQTVAQMAALCIVFLTPARQYFRQTAKSNEAPHAGREDARA